MIALIDISSNTMKKLRRDKMLPSPSWIESKETFQVDDGDITERIRQEIFGKGRAQMDDKKSKVTFELVQNIGTLSESGTWKKELNIVQWGENIAKYDIRAWNADHTKLGKGVTLSTEELKALKILLNDMDL
jgi:hypothetical protein